MPVLSNSTLTTKVGAYQAADRTVPVKFTDTGFTHERRINAVLTPSGEYDPAATKVRALEVASGVQAKRTAGVFDRAAAMLAEHAAVGHTAG